MFKSIPIGILIIVVVVLGGYFLFLSDATKDMDVVTSSNNVEPESIAQNSKELLGEKNDSQPKIHLEIQPKPLLEPSPPSEAREESISLEPKEPSQGSKWSSRLANCKNEPVTLSVAPLDPNVTTKIEPLGKTHGGHVTPTDHMYLLSNVPSGIRIGETALYDVYSPADGFITMERHSNRIGSLDDYFIEIWYSCTLSSIFIHTVALPEDIANAAGAFIPSLNPNFNFSNWFPSEEHPAIFVAAGQVIGKTSGSFDFSLQDTTVTLSGFVNPARYGEEWKIHTVDPLPYFSDSVRSKLIEKIPRTIAPLGGKIDYDVSGRLVGNWFADNKSLAEYLESSDYKDDLAIVYDHIDPTQIRINMGAGTGISEQVCVPCW